MALSTVRALIAGQWHTLTLDPATGYYEAEITAPGTSFHETGGYYNVSIEALNETGVSLTVDGNDFAALRVVVKEATAPSVAFVSPGAGFVTTTTPSVIVDVTDAGAGVDISTLRVLLNGNAVSGAEISTAAISGGYRVTYTPTLGQGTQRVTVRVTDFDGNTGEAERVYIIDTVPPLLADLDYGWRSVVDWATTNVVGRTGDEHAPPATVRITANGADTGAVSIGADGRFTHTVPLKIGGNTIVVTATDIAGLVSTRELYVIRLITDRAQSDVDRLTRLYASGPFRDWSAADKEWFLDGVVRGAYNASDLNRVTHAVEYLAGLLHDRGYTAHLEEGADWLITETPTPEEMAVYLANVDRLRSVFAVDAPETPTDVDALTYGEANDIELILVAVDALLPTLSRAMWSAGEIVCGEY